MMYPTPYYVIQACDIEFLSIFPEWDGGLTDLEIYPRPPICQSYLRFLGLACARALPATDLEVLL